MRRPFRNPFTLLLGATGVLFTVTAASYCLAVLRQTRGLDPDQPPHPLQALMDLHGTSILVGQLALLAVATFGSIALDHAEGVRIRRQRGDGVVPSPEASPRADGPADSGSSVGGGA
jgi:hypothetical protein